MCKGSTLDSFSSKQVVTSQEPLRSVDDPAFFERLDVARPTVGHPLGTGLTLQQTNANHNGLTTDSALKKVLYFWSKCPNNSG